MLGCPKGTNSWAETLDCIRKVDGDTVTRQFYDYFVSIVLLLFYNICFRKKTQFPKYIVFDSVALLENIGRVFSEIANTDN